MLMPTFSSLPATQTDLDKFSRNFQSFSGKLLSEFQKKSKFEYPYIFANLQRMFMLNCSSFLATQTDLDKFLTFFQEIFKVFQESS
jgi:hypothetical protein